MVAQTGYERIGEYPEHRLGIKEKKQDNIVYATYVNLGGYNFYYFDGFVNEDAAKVKERLGYRSFKIELPRTLRKDLNLELVIRENIQMEGRGERPTSPRPSPYGLEIHEYPKPDLKNLKLDVLEGIVY